MRAQPFARRVLCGILILLTLAPRPARPAITDLFGILRPPARQAPGTLADRPPRRLLLNGFPLQVVSGRTAASVHAVLDFYQERCHRAASAALPPPSHRQEDDDSGVLVAAAGDGAELLRQMLARRLHYVHLAPVCLALAQRLGDLTDYVAVFSELPIPPQVLTPPSGRDAPGSDLPGVPRPEGALRSFSLIEPATGYTVISYVSFAPADSAIAAVLSQLRGAGFAEDSPFSRAAQASGQLLKRLEQRGQEVLVSVQPTSAGRSLIVYLVRSR